MLSFCSRRAILRSGGVAFTGVLAGCSSGDSKSPSAVSIAEITIRNRLSRDVEVSVLLTDADQVAYWRTVSVPTKPNPFATLDELPSNPGEYMLYAHIPTTDKDTPVRADLTEDAGDQSCIQVGMEITKGRSDGEEYPAVMYGTIGRCQKQT